MCPERSADEPQGHFLRPSIRLSSMRLLPLKYLCISELLYPATASFCWDILSIVGRFVISRQTRLPAWKLTAIVVHQPAGKHGCYRDARWQTKHSQSTVSQVRIGDSSAVGRRGYAGSRRLGSGRGSFEATWSLRFSRRTSREVARVLEVHPASHPFTKATGKQAFRRPWRTVLWRLNLHRHEGSLMSEVDVWLGQFAAATSALPIRAKRAAWIRDRLP
jgi:hypothetical protein